MQTEKIIRKLARTNYWQNLYKQSTDFSDIGIMFENQKNLSDTQLYLLQWLEIYKAVYQDLCNKESLYLDEAVIDNDIRCNAYLYYKRVKQDQELKNFKKSKETQEFKAKGKGGKTPGEMHTIEFNRRD